MELLDILRGVQQEITVVLFGVSHTIHRSSFGEHILLSHLSDLIQANLGDGDVEGASSLIKEYLLRVGLPVQGERPGVELIAAYREVQQLNRMQLALPFMSDERTDARDAPPYDYPGRSYVWWIHTVASRYGWSRADICAMVPEEVACYVQEVIIASYDDLDQKRSLSELSYERDETTHTATFRPIVRPAWMVASPRRVHFDRSLLPVGIIVDLEERHRKDN